MESVLNSFYVGPVAYFEHADRFIKYPFLNKEWFVRKDINYRAMLNSCLHRGSLLHDHWLGQQKTVCKYHSWAYSNDGSVMNHDCDLKLPSVEIDSDEIFLKKGVITNNRRAYELGEFLGNTTVFHADALIHDCNWKLIVENVSEGLHIDSVHKGSFAPIGFVHAPFSAEEHTANYSYSCLPKSFGGRGYYKHVHLWPNAFFSSTSGLISFCSFIFPISARKTLKLWFLADGHKMHTFTSSVCESIRREAITFATKVLFEDKEILERQQKGVEMSTENHLDELAESRLKWFWAKYREHIYVT
jgi:phenylpropionate dioxygenase-like ring-hydroxylating dioxygenase large terminal subunit